MPAKQMLLVSLLLATGLYTHDSAVAYAGSVDEQRANELIRDLSNREAQQDEAELVQDLRQALDSNRATASLNQVTSELSDPDHPSPCQATSEPANDDAQMAQDLRNALDSSQSFPVLNEVTSELSDPDFPKPIPCKIPTTPEPGAS